VRAVTIRYRGANQTSPGQIIIAFAGRVNQPVPYRKICMPPPSVSRVEERRMREPRMVQRITRLYRRRRNVTIANKRGE